MYVCMYIRLLGTGQSTETGSQSVTQAGIELTEILLPPISKAEISVVNYDSRLKVHY